LSLCPALVMASPIPALIERSSPISAGMGERLCMLPAIQVNSAWPSLRGWANES